MSRGCVSPEAEPVDAQRREGCVKDRDGLQAEENSLSPRVSDRSVNSR